MDLDEIKMWCAGKQWWWRSLLLAWFIFLFVGLLKDPSHANIFGGLNLAIHEMGHLIFSWAPRFLVVAGGTITQLAAPIFGMWNFYQQKDFFAITLCFGWLSTNLFGVCVYANDARSMALPLVSLGGGEGTIHDWNYMLTHLGILPFDHAVAGFFWFLGFLSMIFCLLSGGWMIYIMVKSP